MRASGTASLRPVFRLVAGFMAALIAAGMLTLLSLLGETLSSREQLFLAATLLFMGFVLQVCVRVALESERRPGKALIVAYAISLLAVFWMMLGESGSLLAWAGFLLFANIGGCAMYLGARPAVSGR